MSSNQSSKMRNGCTTRKIVKWINHSQNPLKQLKSSSIHMSQIVLQFVQNAVSSKRNFVLYSWKSSVKCISGKGSRGPIPSWSFLAPTLQRNAWELLGCRIWELAPVPLASSPVPFPALRHSKTVKGIIVITILELYTAP